MVETSEIKDRESLETWLKNQPREVAVWIAARAAARVMPVWWQAVLTQDWARERDLTALPVLRSLLISLVAAKMPTKDMKAAAATAATADATFAADAAVWDAIRWDAEAIRDGAFPDAAPLWPDGDNPLADMWADVRGRVEASEDAAG